MCSHRNLCLSTAESDPIFIVKEQTNTRWFKASTKRIKLIISYGIDELSDEIFKYSWLQFVIEKFVFLELAERDKDKLHDHVDNDNADNGCVG